MVEAIKKIAQLLLALFVLWNGWILAEIIWWKYHNPTVPTSMMRQRQVEKLSHQQLPEIKVTWVPYYAIPNSLKRAVIAEEDANFVIHHGFDWRGIQFALKKDLQSKTIIAGGSTITQQLAKNLFLSSQRNLFRKAEEAMITVMLESLWSKKRILEVYLNVIEWGDGVYGCGSASQHYFNLPIRAINISQAAQLASMIPRPRYYDKHGATKRLINKTNTIQMRMEQIQIPK
ncbi:MAG: monofunctional biosynthetic peptidoglycan transglycosylase [Ferrovum sp. 37-45-19]|jgi:monofunctional biosynthetic peptidoglycan transglycosylase|nr:MAG: monofunctional biosynthetic peptidoglycan transglycosylase [Ferrovum sp. 21-44-67]OYV94628.1 MAG: monofunctional biosynthetic peptidoglycan transglycosylase [Ferrovum sp. 37-45-19]OZB34606.1 MAG: monofunctional biosynthetic peptidoglycan transglycosylase [Ferrovum sp. 34-44-207]HQU06385.1 monofunctional biosynthetic peptidoglycan transglycosylase [Ferrovaceae bacterium]